MRAFVFYFLITEVISLVDNVLITKDGGEESERRLSVSGYFIRMSPRVY